MAISRIQLLELVNRIQLLDEDGGGTITRTFICAPYTSAPTLEAALKGTVVPDTAHAPAYKRVLPNTDPIKPWFRCVRVDTLPFHAGSVRGKISSKFDPDSDDGSGILNGQLVAIQDALSYTDDFDAASNIDNLTPAEILNGGIPDAVSNGYVSQGACGAFVKATYVPQISAAQNTTNKYGGDNTGYDYLMPKWTPITKVSQLGRDLKFIAPILNLGFIGLDYCGGVSDTAAIVEQLWELRITRRMVPFLPQRTFAALQGKINKNPFVIGGQNIGNNQGLTSLVFPPGTVRFEVPSPHMGVTPDGSTYWDIELLFTIRMLWSDYMSLNSDNPPVITTATGWVDWNHQYGVPSVPVVGWTIAPPGYWPIGWKSGFGFTQSLDDFRFLHLYDWDLPTGIVDVRGPVHVGPTMDLTIAPFNCGFFDGQ